MTPKRLNVLRTVLAHPNITLLTLNAPQTCVNGVIPLGMAAWLNMPAAVRVLLEDSLCRVSVDGMDSHGATALMCMLHIVCNCSTSVTDSFRTQMLHGMAGWKSWKSSYVFNLSQSWVVGPMFSLSYRMGLVQIFGIVITARQYNSLSHTLRYCGCASRSSAVIDGARAR